MLSKYTYFHYWEWDSNVRFLLEKLSLATIFLLIQERATTIADAIIGISTTKEKAIQKRCNETKRLRA